jgi:hypothetical protein
MLLDRRGKEQQQTLHCFSYFQHRDTLCKLFRYDPLHYRYSDQQQQSDHCKSILTHSTMAIKHHCTL